MDDRWWSMREICEYLGVSHDTVSRWITSYNMPATKLGKCWKFKKTLVDSWAESRGAEIRKKKTGDKL